MFNTRRRKIIFPAAGLTLLIGILSLFPTAAHALEINVDEDIVYCTRGDVELKLDLARPSKTKGRLPAIIYLGSISGGYYGPCKGQFSGAIRKAAQLGYLAISVDYSVNGLKETARPKWVFPEQLYDAKCAVRWLYANAKKYSVDTRRIGVVGFHWGANLALWIGLTKPADGFEGQCDLQRYSSKVAAVVNLYGPIAVLPEGTSEQYRKASPIKYISKGSPPTLTIHLLEILDIQPSIQLQDVEMLDKTMKDVGATHTLIVKRGHLHHAYRFIWDDDAVWQFLANYLKPSTAK